MSLVVRREEGRLRRYAHVSTGNYHPRTARLYTDFGLLTADEKICEDVNEVFKQLTGLGRARRLHHLWISPFSLHERVLAAIKREANHARAGKPGHIIAKMNALIEPKVIETLYRASQAGVKIDLIVRGVCSLRPGIPGLSENIRVRSVIGRFLEHSRIFYFLNGGQEDLYLSSADWMGRNFFGRIELCFPVLDRRIKEGVIQEGLKPYLCDNSQAWEMNPVGGTERALMIASVLLVLIVELLNSAVEAAVDRISLENHLLAKRAKDIGSAAVFLSLINVAAVWLLVLFG